MEYKLQYLVSQLDHPLPTIRFNAVRSLGELNSLKTIDYLLNVVENDPSSGVRDAAITVLDDLGYTAQAN